MHNRGVDTKASVNGFSYTLLLLSILGASCAPTVFSPHAQNEMVAPYNRTGDIHELGIAPALNIWDVREHEDTTYMRTYPTTSFSFFHNAYYAKGKLSGLGGIELVAFPSSWHVPNAEGFVLLFKPYLGGQYNGDNLTVRLNFTPLSFAVELAHGEWETGGSWNRLILYQLTMLLHNRKPSKHIYWIGARNSPAAIGAIFGYEYAMQEKHIIRMECSALTKPPFSLTLGNQELQSIRGYVFYITAGYFARLK